MELRRLSLVFVVSVFLLTALPNLVLAVDDATLIAQTMREIQSRYHYVRYYYTMPY